METEILLTPERTKPDETTHPLWELTRFVAGIPSRITSAIGSVVLENSDTDYELYMELVSMNEI